MSINLDTHKAARPQRKPIPELPPFVRYYFEFVRGNPDVSARVPIDYLDRLWNQSQGVRPMQRGGLPDPSRRGGGAAHRRGGEHGRVAGEPRGNCRLSMTASEEPAFWLGGCSQSARLGLAPIVVTSRPLTHFPHGADAGTALPADASGTHRKWRNRSVLRDHPSGPARGRSFALQNFSRSDGWVREGRAETLNGESHRKDGRRSCRGRDGRFDGHWLRRSPDYARGTAMIS